jgi:hypothetical protein
VYVSTRRWQKSTSQTHPTNPPPQRTVI